MNDDDVKGKFALLNKVSMSNLNKTQALVLTELILRSDRHGVSYPSKARLAKAAKVKIAKNLEGLAKLLPGLVEEFGWHTYQTGATTKQYKLNKEAIMALPEFGSDVEDDYPSTEGYPADEGNLPLQTTSLQTQTTSLRLQTDYPSVEGLDSTKNSSEDSSKNSSGEAPVDQDLPYSLGSSLSPYFPKEEIVASSSQVGGSLLQKASGIALVDAHRTARVPAENASHQARSHRKRQEARTELKRVVLHLEKDESLDGRWDDELFNEAVTWMMDKNFYVHDASMSYARATAAYKQVTQGDLEW